jgi:myo-inositol-1(or 4)-monophosphatase
LKKELDTVISVVRQAGEAIIRIADEQYKIAEKSADKDVLTAADLEADRILRENLTAEFPDYGWLSEETKGQKGQLEHKRIWIVDPLDGTREFVMKNPEFVVSVALVEDGKPILGVIYNPSTDELFETAADYGVKLNGNTVSSNHKLSGKAVVEVSRSDIAKGIFNDIGDSIELRPCGSIAYKLARLSAGMADSVISLTPKNEWDIAAGVVLVKAAGGIVRDKSDNEFVFNRGQLLNGVVAASKDAYNTIVKVVGNIEK